MIANGKLIKLLVERCQIRQIPCLSLKRRLFEHLGFPAFEGEPYEVDKAHIM